MKGCGEIMDVGNGVAVRDSNIIKCTVITTWTPVTRGLFGHHVEEKQPVTG